MSETLCCVNIAWNRQMTRYKISSKTVYSNERQKVINSRTLLLQPQRPSTKLKMFMKVTRDEGHGPTAAPKWPQSGAAIVAPPQPLQTGTRNPTLDNSGDFSSGFSL